MNSAPSHIAKPGPPKLGKNNHISTAPLYLWIVQVLIIGYIRQTMTSLPKSAWKQAQSWLAVALTALVASGSAFAQAPLTPQPSPVIADKKKNKLLPCYGVAPTGLLDDRLRINLRKRLLAIDSATLLSGFER